MNPTVDLKLWLVLTAIVSNQSAMGCHLAPLADNVEIYALMQLGIRLTYVGRR